MNSTKSIRNPAWTRDEVILALDLYFRHNPSRINKNHAEVIALSRLLSQLPVHNLQTVGQDFRNPNGVYMKLGNFLSIDPDYLGKGLSGASAMDHEIWDEFSKDHVRLRETAEAIKEGYTSVESSALDSFLDDDEEYIEGKVLTRLHKLRERNRTVVRKKKEAVIKETGRLACEVCDFDFAVTYGDLGYGYAECHHVQPLNSLKYGTPTRLSDLAIVCANCHRMLHKGKELKAIQALREVVIKRKANY